MAHKGVVGAVTLGVAGYAAHERFKDWEVELERRERKQEEQDRRDEYMRRLEEAERKRGESSAMRSGIAGDLMAQREFQVKVYAHLDEILYGLVMRCKDEGTPLRSEGLRQLKLPLMSHEYDEDDLMLAAAFVLGDRDLVERVVPSFEKQKLGIGLNKFTARSIKHIISVLESVDEPDISHDMLSTFISLGVFRSDFRERKPKLLMLNDEIGYSKKLCRWGKKFNMNVVHISMLKGKRPNFVAGKAKYEFDDESVGPRGERRERSGLGLKFLTLHPAAEAGGVILTNFCCQFETTIKSETKTQFSVHHPLEGTVYWPTFEKISLLGRHQRVRTPNDDRITKVFAEKLAAGIAKAAAHRLKQLLSQKTHEEGISHEHICALSGNSSDLLRLLRQHDENMIQMHSDKIAGALYDSLNHSVPPPNKADVKTGESPKEHLDREITQFVTSYIKLVHLSYCEVPLLMGKPPSSFVPKFSVCEAARLEEDCIWKATPMMHLATRRLLEKEEEARFVRSRFLVTPGKVASFAFVALSWAISSWLCAVTTDKVLHSVFPLHSIVALFAASQVFTAFTLHSLLGIFKTRVFGLGDDSSWSVVVSCCTEYIQRTIAIKCGQPTPFDREMLRLKGICKAQYGQWRLRIAKGQFQAALQRKRITTTESVLLLTDFAANYYETEDEEILEGVIPASLSEAEEFLKMRVEEGQLSPDETLRHYLLTNGGNGDKRSPIDTLCDLGARVQECVQFSEGDRVVVRFDEDDEHSSSSSPKSTCTDLSLVLRGGNQTGSVVFCTATLCFVHFDGEPTNRPVPMHLCSLLDENSVPYEDSASESGDNSDDEFVEGVGEVTDADVGESVRRAPPLAKKRAQTNEEALVDGNWEFVRCKKHMKFSRRVKLKSDGSSRKQTVTMSKTPSDRRAEKNALALLRRLNEDEEVEVISEESSSMMCIVCHEVKQDADFSKSQLKRGVHMKCKDCVSKL